VKRNIYLRLTPRSRLRAATPALRHTMLRREQRLLYFLDIPSGRTAEMKYRWLSATYPGNRRGPKQRWMS